MSDSESLTDAHLNWAQSFTGLDLGAGASGGEAGASSGSDAPVAPLAAVEEVSNTVRDFIETTETQAAEVVGEIETAAGAVVQAVESGISDNSVPLADPAAGPCTEQPAISDNSPVPTTIDADSVVDFVNGVNNALGGNAHCLCDVGDNPDTDPATGKVTKANVTVVTKIVRPRLGLSRAKGKDRDLILKAVDLIKTHEESHRAIVRSTYASYPCALVGKKTDAELKTVRDSYDKTHSAAQDALDNKSGKLKIVMTDGVPTDVILVPR